MSIMFCCSFCGKGHKSMEECSSCCGQNKAVTINCPEPQLKSDIILQEILDVLKSIEKMIWENGIKTDNRLENLEWVTHKENSSHKDNILGKHTRGERHGRAILNEDMVREIKRMFLKYRICEVSKMTGINQSTIRMIKIGRSWRNVVI